jgi:putative sigma-54 modulation protein
VNIVVNARHVEMTDSIRGYIEKKVAKLPKYYDLVNQIEVMLDKVGNKPSVEIIVTAARKNTFVASSTADDVYAAIDQALDKSSQQLRRHKDRVRDRQGPPHSQTMSMGEVE